MKHKETKPKTARKPANNGNAESSNESSRQAEAVTGTIAVEPATYGILCAGAKVNGFPSWEAAAAYMLNEMACEWQNDNYRVR